PCASASPRRGRSPCIGRRSGRLSRPRTPRRQRLPLSSPTCPPPRAAPPAASDLRKGFQPPMSLRINSNVDAMEAHRQLAAPSDKISQSMERLSSGLRINKAADDAAGLGISEKMRGQINGLAQAQRNIQDGVSMVQTAEGNLDEVHSILQRVRELAVEYKNGALSTAGKAAITSEVNALSSEIDRIQKSATFNGITLLTDAPTFPFQVGAT